MPTGVPSRITAIGGRKLSVADQHQIDEDDDDRGRVYRPARFPFFASIAGQAAFPADVVTRRQRLVGDLTGSPGYRPDAAEAGGTVPWMAAR